MSKKNVFVLGVILFCYLFSCGVYAKDADEYDYVYENGKVSKVLNGREVLNEYHYNDEGYADKIVARGENILIKYNIENNVDSASVNDKVIKYNYTYNERGKYNMLVSLEYDGDTYYIQRNSSMQIEYLCDEDGSKVVKYEYNDDTYEVKTYSFNGVWTINNDSDFVGNMNKIRNNDYLYVDSTGLVIIHGSVFDKTNNKYLFENKYERKLLPVNTSSDWETDEVDAYNWCMSLLSTSTYGNPITYSTGWYNSLSEVELLARLIYGENTVYYSDQIAISYVLMNRLDSSSFPNTFWNVATQANAFQTITGYSPNALSPTKASEGWKNATFLACLLLTTTNRYSWSQITGTVSGMSNQLFFVGGSYAINNSLFRDYGGNLQYCMDGTWRNINSVCVPGYGIQYNYSGIVSALSNYNNSCNVHFNIS